MLGRTIASRFRLEGIVGAGGMAIVFAARDLLLQREVGIKMLSAEYQSQPAAISRFAQETKLASRLSGNPHVVTVYDYRCDEDGSQYIVYELLKGRSLRSIIDDREWLPSHSRVVEVAIQTLRAIVDMHRLGIVHQDVKPENIVEVNHEVCGSIIKLIDFGISSSPDLFFPEAPRVARGTPKYLAPELVRGCQPVLATDIYSLGLVLYEFSTNQFPYRAHSVEQLFQAHASEEPARFPPEKQPFPESYEQLVLRMLAKDPLQRPSARECLHELCQVAKQVTN